MLFFLNFLSHSTLIGSCFINASDRKPFAIIGKRYDGAAAWGEYDDNITMDGWGRIRIETNPNVSSMDQVYCGGYIDTFLSYQRVNYSMTYFMRKAKYNGGWKEKWVLWAQKNMEFVQRGIENNNSTYWYRIRLVVEQVKGMMEGYNDKSRVFGRVLSFLDFWIFQSAADFDDIERSSNPAEPYVPELNLKCSGLVKIAPNFDDIFIAQDIWAYVTEMEAYLKEYRFFVNEFSSKTVVLSTRTGHLSSIDDFWANDRGLIVLETSLNNFNKTLDSLVSPESILTWMRAYVAAWSASTGEEWANEFVQYNSGTYNNQYLVLDSKAFSQGKKPKKDLLWIIEQLPSYYRSEDITNKFVEQGWWPSINTPFFENMFIMANYSGQQQAEPDKKDIWSYYKQPRYRIFERDAPHVNDFEGFKKLMRYNNWENDPLMLGDPSFGIIARYDLRPKNGTKYGPRYPVAGLDSKAVMLSEIFGNLMFEAINSPNYEQNPPFRFSDWPMIASFELPNVWRFPWVNFSSKNYNRCSLGDNNESHCHSLGFCGFCVYSSQCLPGKNKDHPNRGFTCSEGWTYRIPDPWYASILIICISIFNLLIVIFVFVGSLFYDHITIR